MCILYIYVCFILNVLNIWFDVLQLLQAAEGANCCEVSSLYLQSCNSTGPQVLEAREPFDLC